LQKAAAPSRNIAGFAWIVVAFNVALAIGGAFVRATGSGAGCGNHWPLCNGQVVIGTPSMATVIEFVHRSVTGIDAAMILGLLAWTFRAFPKRHAARLGAVLSTVFKFSEALIGATLVKFGLVVHDASPARAAVLSLHLVNTLTFLACLTLTARWAGGHPRIRVERSAWVSIAAVTLLAISGALAALADTLYPVHSLAAGFMQELTPGANFAVRLRAAHPIIAAAVSLWLISYAISRAPAAQRLTHVVVATVVAQLLVGVVNLLLLAPIGMQLAHLLLADLLWIALVVLCWNAEGQPGIAVDGSKILSCCHASNVVGTNSPI
jgi:heme a synthase